MSERTLASALVRQGGVLIPDILLTVCSCGDLAFDDGRVEFLAILRSLILRNAKVGLVARQNQDIDKSRPAFDLLPLLARRFQCFHFPYATFLAEKIENQNSAQK